MRLKNLFFLTCLCIPVNCLAEDEFYHEVTSMRGVQQPVWVIEKDNAKASLLLFAGGKGKLRLGEQGIRKGKKNFLIRTRERFAEYGFNIVLVDKPSDQASLFMFRTGDEHAQDVAAVIKFVREKYKLPVWLVGTSRGTISVANAASRLQGVNGPDGIVLTSSVLVTSQQPSLIDVNLASIRVPTLFVHNKDDDCHVCPFNELDEVMGLVEKVKDKGLQIYEGGQNKSANPCNSMTPHGFLGLEEKVIRDIVSWIGPRLHKGQGIATRHVPATNL